MKKILAGVGVCILALGVLSYPGFGYLLERQLAHQIAQMPKQYGMSLQLKNFKRHWFSSDAVLHWEWHVPGHLTQNLQGQTVTVSPKNFEKDFQVTIFHGPIVFKSHSPFFGIGYAKTSFDWPLEQRDNAKAFTPDTVFPKVNLNFAVDFLMRTNWETDIPAFQLISSQNQNKFVWNGMALSNRISAHLDKIKGQFRLIGLDVINEAQTIGLQHFDSHYAFKLDNSGLYVGDLNFSIESMHMNEFEFKNLHINNHSSVENELFTTEIDAALKSMKFNGLALGPLELDLQLGHLDAATLKKIHQSFQQQQNASPSFRNRGLWSLTSSVPELLKNGLLFHVKKCHLVLENGAIDGQMNLQLPADNAGIIFNLQRLQNIVGDAKVKVTQSMLKDWLIELVAKQLGTQPLSLENTPYDPAQIKEVAQTRVVDKLNSLVKAGVLTEESSNYLINMKLENGQLIINNLPFDPSWLII